MGTETHVFFRVDPISHQHICTCGKPLCKYHDPTTGLLCTLHEGHQGDHVPATIGQATSELSSALLNQHLFFLNSPSGLAIPHRCGCEALLCEQATPKRGIGCALNKGGHELHINFGAHVAWKDPQTPPRV